MISAVVATLLSGSEQDVDVGGHALRVKLAGTDGPTVVLESALGNGLAVWHDVQAASASFARVVAYDRAGLGNSEAGPLPRTSKQIAQELHELLGALHLEPPFVLVGHSAGGFHVRTFAALFPDEVAALVLVDATHEQVDEHFRELDPERWRTEREALEELYARWPSGIQAEWFAAKAVLDEGQLPDVGGLPDVPTVVLTATRTSDEAEWMGRTPQAMRIWIALQKAWAKPLSNAVHVLTDRSGHYMQTDVPGLVIASIREACRVAQEGGKLSDERLQQAARSDTPEAQAR